MGIHPLELQILYKDLAPALDTFERNKFELQL